MISVVMPVYNGERFLVEAIESILNQTYRELEFIVVDDGSTDSTPKILKRYAERDNRVVIVQSGHVGISGAMNKGVSVAKYPWVARMDADDVALPNRFERQLAEAQKSPDVVVWGSYIHHINSKGRILSLSKVGPATREEFESRLQRGATIQVINPSSLMRKDLILKVGGYKDAFSGTEDIDIFDELSQYGPILTIPEVLILYRIHGSSVSMTRYFSQRRLSRYIDMRRKNRLAGQPIPSLEQFTVEYENKPRLERLARYLNDLRGLYYRRAGMAYGEQQYLKMGYYFAISALLGPRYPIVRAWHQVGSHLLPRQNKQHGEQQASANEGSPSLS